MRHLFIWEFINFNPYPRFHNILLTVCNWFLGCCHFFRENYLIFFFNHTFRLLMVPTTKIQSPNTFTQTQFDYPFSKTELHFPNIALQFPNKNLPPSPLFFFTSSSVILCRVQGYLLGTHSLQILATNIKISKLQKFSRDFMGSS